MPKGSRVEIKTDLASSTTGNYFLEYWQTFDGWTTIKTIGIALACIQSKYLCIVNQERLLLIDTTILRGYLYRHFSSLQHRETGRGSNGNRDGCHTVGMLVPTASLIRLAKGVYDCVNPLTSDWEFKPVLDLQALKKVLGEPSAVPQIPPKTGPITNPFKP